MKNRAEILSLLGELAQTPTAGHDEVMAFIEAHDLARSGLGHVGMHLLAAAFLAGVPLWTLDRRLEGTARRLRVRFLV